MKTLLAAVAVLAGSIPAASGQNFPSRPVTLVVPFAAGGPVDTIARILSVPMAKTLGQPVLVESVTGAAGTLGVGRVARAAPDGYTLSIGHWSTHVINGAVYPIQYDLLKDLEPLAMIAANPLLIVASASVPARDLKELLAWLKSNPGKASAGTAGAGSASHVGGVYFRDASGAKFEFIPYRGTAPAMQDLVAGRIDLMVDQASNSIPQVRGGRIKAYAVTAKTRLAVAPDIPTVDEAGLPGLYVSVWYGIWAPGKTPRDIVARLNSAIVAALADSTVRRRLAELGQEIPPREQQTPEYLAAYHKAEIEKWWPLVKAAGIRGE
ncbi:MAG: tripartite tricarboxylate transporter substrate binding protein BugD [Betaproteobacteria bacterium]|nr:MAG: tripartite tricarboxylate transporter substrate binding protein BugD [Betaproteobacteria bacterium]